MLLRVTGLEKAFGIVDIFKNVNFEIRKGDKVGLVGANGAGKTTLMRCLMREEEADVGGIAFDTAASVGYVEQQAEFVEGTLHQEFLHAFSDILELEAKKRTLEQEIAQNRTEEKLAEYGTVLERFEHLGGYDFESRIRRVAFGLGFTEADLEKDTTHFSGGQKTRICLAKALLREPDFLFLDEPTNHLDIGMIEWLENFLSAYTGGVLLISHDRFFLDRVANRIFDLENKRITSYEGNYTYFARVKDDRRAALSAAYAKQQAQIQKTEEYIRRYKAGIKSKQARGRQSQLNRMERIVLPPESASFRFFALHKPAECAERVVEIEDLSFGYGKEKLFSNINLLIRKGDGIALVGDNGTGKTTLLRLLLGEIEPKAGRIKIGSRVKIGYFSQQHEGLNPENTLLDELLWEFGITEEQGRSYLGAFLFHGDEAYRKIGELSGGEQARLAFLKLMLTGANFLVLDEPTNHLDIPAKNAIEEALMAFPGTFLVVSHDRYFLDRVANCTLELAAGKVTEYQGNYSYYRTKKALLEEMQGKDVHLQSTKAKVTSQKAEASMPPTKKDESADGLKRRVQGMSEEKKKEMLQRAEAELAMAEAELKGLEYQMNDPAVQADPEKSMEIAEAYAAKEKEVEERYEYWGQLAE